MFSWCTVSRVPKTYTSRLFDTAYSHAGNKKIRYCFESNRLWVGKSDELGKMLKNENEIILAVL